MTGHDVQISNSSGQIQVGDHNTMSQTTVGASGLTEEEMRRLRASIDGLRALVAGTSAPRETQQAAEERLNDLAEEVRRPGKESRGRLSRILHWFEENMPELAGAVGTLIGGPLIGTLIQGAGAQLQDPEG
jgi:hypothetical protein